MNYFLANLFRDKVLWGALGLSALAGLIIMDVLTYMLTPRAVFGLWTVKLSVGAAIVAVILYGLFLHRREKRGKRLESLLPGFLEERRMALEKMAAAAPGFQTLCHECRHFDPRLLGCRLELRERKFRIRLDEESPFRHCLYWNLDGSHPVMRLTRKRGAVDGSGREDEKGAGE